jgi:hypothetical protein
MRRSGAAAAASNCPPGDVEAEEAVGALIAFGPLPHHDVVGSGGEAGGDRVMRGAAHHLQNLRRHVAVDDDRELVGLPSIRSAADVP